MQLYFEDPSMVPVFVHVRNAVFDVDCSDMGFRKTISSLLLQTSNSRKEGWRKIYTSCIS